MFNKSNLENAMNTVQGHLDHPLVSYAVPKKDSDRRKISRDVKLLIRALADLVKHLDHKYPDER